MSWRYREWTRAVLNLRVRLSADLVYSCQVDSSVTLAVSLHIPHLFIKSSTVMEQFLVIPRAVISRGNVVARLRLSHGCETLMEFRLYDVTESLP